MKRRNGLMRGLPLVGVVLLAACAAPSALPPEALEPLPLPPDALELEPIPTTAEPDAVSPMRSTGQAGPGVLPGTLEQGHFERRLQERRKRVHLGLDRPQREQEPVDNLIDFDF